MRPLDTMEKKILRELNFEHNKKFKSDQFMEWGTHELTPQDGEQIFHVKRMGVNVAIKL